MDDHQSIDLRKAFSHYATGVTIMTSGVSALFPEPLGITVNSFTSVSLKPPLVLWAIDKKSSRYHCFQQSSLFGISVLSKEQKHIAEYFTKNAEITGINHHDWQKTEKGIYFLKDSLSCFECKIINRIHAGDHTILIGEVIFYMYNPTRKTALTYYNSGYNSIK